MSRTDKDAPDWVRALHAAQDGRRTVVRHSLFCVDYTSQFRSGPVVDRWMRVTRADAIANGYVISPYWADEETSEFVHALVPYGPFPCDIDVPGNRCARHTTGGRRRSSWFTTPSSDERHLLYFGPERAAVRDSLREAAKEYRATGEVDTEPSKRQTRGSMWVGGWWD